MRTLLEKYNIRYFLKIANELQSSPVKRIIIYWIQLLGIFLVQPYEDEVDGIAAVHGFSTFIYEVVPKEQIKELLIVLVSEGRVF